MPLEARRREVENIAILDLQGRLVAGQESGELRKIFVQLLHEEKKNLILNLKHVDFIDSTGLGNLVIGHTTFENAGGAMKLLHASKRNMELLILTKLSTVFEIFDDEEAAINSFFPDREVKPFDILEFVKNRKSEKEQ